MRIILKSFGFLILFLFILISLIVIASGLALRASLARNEGQVNIVGLIAPVSVRRDSLGVVDIHGESRMDVSMALGFVHAQERFFQMDLARRRPAGRMSELFGPPALNWDTRLRAHRLRLLADKIVRDLPNEKRREIEAYCEGVNAGLKALPGLPFEYIMLQVKPENWVPADSVLVVFSMFLTLNPWEGNMDLAYENLHEGLPPDLFDFLVTQGTRMDAPMLGEAFFAPELPGPEVFSLRDHPEKLSQDHQTSPEETVNSGTGSNAWAVSGKKTTDGRAILACDMHLPLMVPTSWFRACLQWPEQSLSGEEIRIVGVTLPGTPGIIAGSNSHIAWGFTNSYGDWVDLVGIDPVGIASYHSPEGLLEFENFSETINIRGEDPVSRQYQSTIWGPVVAENRHGRPLALRWTAEMAGGVNFNLLDLETAQSLDEALSIGPRCGMPPQNLVVADSTGRIGWTIAGRIPFRRNCGQAWPPRILEAQCTWDGWVDPSSYPRISDPASGVIWTANARVVDGNWLNLLGDGGYNLGARAAQIRDALLPIENTSETAMLKIQLDDRALFLGWWRNLLLKTLNSSDTSLTASRRELKSLVEDWSGRASIDDAGYRMVRAFRIYTRSLVLDPLTQKACEGTTTPCGWEYLGQREGPLQKIIEVSPFHLLNPSFATWDDLFLAAADHVIADFTSGGKRLKDHPWGERNTLRMSHPLSGGLPEALGNFLNMPRTPLPGDTEMPRIQGPTFGASERLVVSPGHEEDGIFQMPGGQSGNPLSPFFMAGHQDWVEGRPSALLPGNSISELLLLPGENGKLPE